MSSSLRWRNHKLSVFIDPILLLSIVWKLSVLKRYPLVLSCTNKIIKIKQQLILCNRKCWTLFLRLFYGDFRCREDGIGILKLTFSWKPLILWLWVHGNKDPNKLALLYNMKTVYHDWQVEAQPISSALSWRLLANFSRREDVHRKRLQNMHNINKNW